MKKKMIVITLTTIMILCVISLLGFVALVTGINDQRSCEWSNIDNIELHARVDIPQVIQSDCSYNKADNIKKASFTIDITKVDLNAFIKNNKLQKLPANFKPEYDNFLNFRDHSLPAADLYYRKTQSNGERADILFNKQTARLWVTISYEV